jgi:hypothetical protein
MQLCPRITEVSEKHSRRVASKLHLSCIKLHQVASSCIKLHVSVLVEIPLSSEPENETAWFRVADLDSILLNPQFIEGFCDPAVID